LTEVRGLDGLGTLRFTSSGDLYIDASDVYEDRQSGDGEILGLQDGIVERAVISDILDLITERTHVGPVGGGLCVDGNSSE